MKINLQDNQPSKIVFLRLPVALHEELTRLFKQLEKQLPPGSGVSTLIRLICETAVSEGITVGAGTEKPKANGRSKEVRPAA